MLTSKDILLKNGINVNLFFKMVYINSVLYKLYIYAKMQVEKKKGGFR